MPVDYGPWSNELTIFVPPRSSSSSRSSLNSSSSINANQFNLSFDFSISNYNFIPGWSDLPYSASAFTYNLFASHITRPSSLGSGSALFIAGINRSDDLFMFWKRKISNLPPNTRISIAAQIKLGSKYREGLMGVGGAPGEGVTLKFGAVTFEPVPVLNISQDLVMNLDKGNQTVGGIDMKTIGDIAKPNDGDDNKYVLLAKNSEPHFVTTSSDGEAWIIFGTDSGYEGLTELYYTNLDLTITVPTSSSSSFLVSTSSSSILSSSSHSSTSSSISSSSYSSSTSLVSKPLYFAYDNSPQIQSYITRNSTNVSPIGLNNYYYISGETPNFPSSGLFLLQMPFSLDLNPSIKQDFSSQKAINVANPFLTDARNSLINDELTEITLTGCEGANFSFRSLFGFVDSGNFKILSIPNYNLDSSNISLNSFGISGGPNLASYGDITLPNLTTLNQSISDTNLFSFEMELKNLASAPFDSLMNNPNINEQSKSYIRSVYTGIVNSKSAIESGYSGAFYNKKIKFNFKTISRPVWGDSAGTLPRSHNLSLFDFYQRSDTGYAAGGNWGWPNTTFRSLTGWYNLQLQLLSSASSSLYTISCAPSLVYPGLKWRFSNFDNDLNRMSNYISNIVLLNNNDLSPTGLQISLTANRSAFIDYINFKPYVLGMENLTVDNHPYYGCKLRIERR